MPFRDDSSHANELKQYITESDVALNMRFHVYLVLIHVVSCFVRMAFVRFKHIFCNLNLTQEGDTKT